MNKKSRTGQGSSKGSWKAVKKVISAVLKCILTVFLVGIITGSLVGCIMVIYVVTSFKDDAGIPDLQKVSGSNTSVVYTDNNGDGNFKEYMRLEGNKSVWADMNDIPVYMQKAVIAIEDERFEQHYGVDWKRTVSAFANYVFHFRSTEYGGSTITQQLIKTITQDNEHSAQRKITEILRAVEMERRYTKDDILEAYLNVIPLSGGYSGVGAGANYYFGKDVKDLSLAQCACLASITNNPSQFNPYKHPQNLRNRQHLVLAKMYQLNFITKDEYKQAINEELVFKSNIKATGVQDYYTDLLIDDVIHDLMDKYGYTENYAESLVYYGGLKIYSCEQPALQAKAEAVYTNESNFPKHISSDKKDPNACIIVMDYKGQVVATVGGRGEKTGNRVLNRSTQSKLQPGSSIKPLSVYGPALEYNLINYSSVVRNAPITLANGKKFPTNYGSSSLADRGSTLLVNGVVQSLNTVSVQTLKTLTLQRSYDFLHIKLGFTSLIDSKLINGSIRSDKDYSPLGLGSFTYGVYAREMAAGFQIYGNGGVYNKPTTYYSVKTGDDEHPETILEYKPTNLQVVSKDTAYVMNRILQQVIRNSSGTAHDLSSYWPKMEVFAKTGTTGTTHDSRNVFFCGGTPYYVGASWFGYDYDQNIHSSQVRYAKTLWNKVMQALHQGKPTESFTIKGDTKELRYCTATGLLATTGCPHTAIGVYKADNIPAYCTAHGGSIPSDGSSETKATDTTTTVSDVLNSTTTTLGTTTTTGAATSTTGSTTTTIAVPAA